MTVGAMADGGGDYGCSELLFRSLIPCGCFSAMAAFAVAGAECQAGYEHAAL